MEKKLKQYREAVGRRKTSSARVRLTESTKDTIIVNDKEIKIYFPTKELQTIVLAALKLAERPTAHEVTVKVSGGGIHSQAEAIRHGIARILSTGEEIETASNKAKLKKEGMLKRDPRSKERRKFGLKKARKAPQWSKR
mgnify:CR=1 FL=1